jgi:hypothetical protein
MRAPVIDGSYDSIVMINVLEHILDDGGTLNYLAKFLNPGGNLIIYVPALNWLYGSWDRKIGHYRRYSKARLAGVIDEAGLTVRKIHYVNAIAIPAWYAFSKLGIRRNDDNGDQAPSAELKAWDRYVIPVTRFVESVVRPPIGLDVLAIARPSDGR